MKKAVKKSFVLWIAALMTLAGCRCPQTGAFDDSVTFTMNSSRNVKLLWADSHRQDDKIVVHGAFSRQSSGSTPMTAHVDVQMLSSNGELLQQVRTPEMKVPRKLPGKGISSERFEVELDDDGFTDNPTIILSAHQGNCDV